MCVLFELEMFSIEAIPQTSRGRYIADVCFICNLTSYDTHTHTLTRPLRDMHPDTRTRSAVESTGLYSREFGDCEESTGCRVVETSSHAPRKVTAVSLSSTSSAAVPSILPREKSLMDSPSTTFQVLFCWGWHTHTQISTESNGRY